MRRILFLSRKASAFILAGAVLMAGCGKEVAKDPRVTVSGQVKFKGDPLPGGMVFFHVISDQGPQVATAPIDANGKYKASLVTPGKARIAVDNRTLKPAKGATSGTGPGRYVPIDVKYALPATSGLTAEVGTGDQTHDIELR